MAVRQHWVGVMTIVALAAQCALPVHAAAPAAVAGKPAQLAPPAMKEVSLCDGGGVVRGFVPAKAKSKPPPVFPEFDACVAKVGCNRVHDRWKAHPQCGRA
jgi:hypothetical protein